MATQKPQQKSPKKSSPGKSKLLRWIKLSLFLIVVYLVGSGPVLWSRSVVSNETYRKGVIYYVAPLMWANYQLREKSLVEQVGLPDLTPAPNTAWYDWLESYWGLFGERTLHEADRITVILKFKFAGVADVETTSKRL